jgi:quercetin dioxygenase-like cupin family protein
MRSKVGAASLAGLVAGLTYGAIMQVTTSPMADMPRSESSNGDAPMAESESHTLLSTEEMVWTEAPSPAGAQLTVLEGDPKAAGPFTFRLRLQPDTRVPVHTHPTTERVTVLSGAVHMGVGDTFNAEETRPLPPGSVAIMPPGMRMFWFTTDETVIQIHGEGPWAITYVEPVEGSNPQATTSSRPTGGSEMSAALTKPKPMGDREPLIMMVADVVRSDSLAVAWGVLLLGGVIMGALFGLLLGNRITSVSAGLGWGLLYGVFWWVLGTLLVMPILLGMSPFGPVTMAPMRFAAAVSLLAYVLSGLLLGAFFAALIHPQPRPIS